MGFFIFICMSKDKIKGGLSDKMSKKDIADKFNVSIQKIDKQIQMGIKVEMEHVNSKSQAREIAMDHLVEVPDYYTRLAKMEKEAKKKWDIKESRKSNIQKLLREGVELHTTDETPESTTFMIKYNDRDAGEIVTAPNIDVEHAIELVFVGLLPEYQDKGMLIIQEVISALWNEFQGTHKILVTPKADSRGFWAKMGAHRLNDSYMMISRGH